MSGATPAPLTLAALNALPADEAREAFGRCCGSPRWVERMVAARPFAHADEVLELAARAWWELSPDDWRSAFALHPKIGDLESLKRRFAATADLAGREQAGTAAAAPETLAALAEGNRAYEERFGYIFIVFASGRTADEMLTLLRQRLPNDPEAELKIAAAEQVKIMRLRLQRMMGGSS
jgi:2-oxo-4-hydroxy-4-carboxy-5-ureidoimidazoline decarboxylase